MWSDVDFKKRLITLRETKARVVQYQPMNETALQAFKRLRELPRHVSGEVFYWINRMSGDPNMPQYGKLYNTWIKYCKMAGVNNCTWHALRHAYASRMVRTKVHIVVVKELMRHANIETHYEIYHFGPYEPSAGFNCP